MIDNYFACDAGKAVRRISLSYSSLRLLLRQACSLRELFPAKKQKYFYFIHFLFLFL